MTDHHKGNRRNFKIAMVILLFFLTYFRTAIQIYYPENFILPDEILLFVMLCIVAYLWIQEVKDKNYLLLLHERLKISNEKLEQEIQIRKEREQELRAAHDELGIRVQERTEELLKAKDYAERFFQVVPSAVFTLDKNKYIVSWNINAEKLTGYMAKEMVGKRCVEFTKSPCRDFCHLYDANVKKPIIGEECILVRKDGRDLIVLKSADLLKDDKGNIIGGIESFEDITERKMVEEELRLAREELERRVNERTQELSKAYDALKVEVDEHLNAQQELGLAYSQLKDAQQQIIEAEKMQVVGRLASGVAHEVKNPLAIIMQGLDFFNTTIQNADEHSLIVLKHMSDAVKRADNIIRGLLDFSSVARLEVSPCDINRIVTKALLLTNHQLNKCHIKVIQELQDNLPDIELDRNKIEQVFVNLILNAVHAMAERGTLTLRTYLREIIADDPVSGFRNGVVPQQSERIVVTEIEDTGTGIPDEILNKIFEPFFTTRRNVGGTGMGLSIVKNLIEMHNGQININNKPQSSGAVVKVMFWL
ncbi:MAG: ATP-binding protein [Candidatus Omnitrophica bacterium]|nr:ATP-binding protein [Candidatus Omnitrophota bacterium]